jgi:hypothetical protein
MRRVASSLGLPGILKMVGLARGSAPPYPTEIARRPHRRSRDRPSANNLSTNADNGRPAGRSRRPSRAFRGYRLAILDNFLRLRRSPDWLRSGIAGRAPTAIGTNEPGWLSSPSSRASSRLSQASISSGPIAGGVAATTRGEGGMVGRVGVGVATTSAWALRSFIESLYRFHASRS